MSKFDLILLFIFSLIVAVCGANVWLIVHAFEQFAAGFWTFVTAVCAGEVVTFSLYRVAKGHQGQALDHSRPRVGGKRR